MILGKGYTKMTTYRINSEFEFENSKEISYRAYKLHSSQHKSNDFICESILGQVKNNLNSINQKLYLMDILSGKYHFSLEIQEKAKNLLDKLLINHDQIKKNEIMLEIDNFINLTRAIRDI